MPLDPRQRKAALVLRGVSQADIARRAGVTATHVSDVLHGRRRSPRVERAIAEALGRAIEDLFPEPQHPMRPSVQ